MMKRNLRILAAAVALIAVIAWLALGANTGWTKTSVPVKTVDEVTGIEAINYQKKWVPGVDALGGALVLAGVLIGASFLFSGGRASLNDGDVRTR